jgi:hypothetical protein
MAKHGSKKWIKTYDGRIKRSNDRTWKDWRSDLKVWTPMDAYRRSYYKDSKWADKRNFCPQCKHVQKPIIAEYEHAQRLMREAEAAYAAVHGDAQSQWQTYRSKRWKAELACMKGDFAVPYPILPKVPEPPTFHKWRHEEGWYIPHFYQSYNTRSYLCYKCEFKYETQRRMYDAGYPGRRENWRVGKRISRKYYRSEVKHVLRSARYVPEFEGYDDILPRRKEWLD